MFIEKIKSEGLAHLSYLIGGGGEAAVIDPRRDCAIYVEMARQRECRITHIFETHRNEDLVSGAPVLAKMTGAEVHHGPHAAGEVAYADTVREGASFSFGSMCLKVMETPGHTDDSISLAVYDTEFGDDAVGVFTGDALFVGDVGRTDFYPDRAREVAGLLFDSLRKIANLGDQALIYPAHGAGSVCGDGMADREFSSIGYERTANPMMRIEDRESFIDRKVNEHHYQPPYFRLMEKLNLEGGEAADRVITPKALNGAAFSAVRDEAVIVDVRGIASFLGAHLSGSLAIPSDMVPAFAGWLLDADDRIVLMADDEKQATVAATHFARIGYDRIEGFLTVAMTGWAAGGGEFGKLPAVDVETVRERVNSPQEDWSLIDVREKPEVEKGMIPGAKHMFIGKLQDRLIELDKDGSYTVMCASGARATIAASILRRAGIENVDVFLGSMGAWKSANLPLNHTGNFSEAAE